MFRGKRIYANGLANWIHEMTHVVKRVVHEGVEASRPGGCHHRRGSCWLGGGAGLLCEGDGHALEVWVGSMLYGKTAQDVTGAAQFGRHILDTIWLIAVWIGNISGRGVIGMTRIGMSAVSSILLELAQVVDQLAVDLFLGADQLLQMDDLIDEYFVGSDNLAVWFLETLDLVLHRSELFRECSHLLSGSGAIELFIHGLGLSGRRGLSADVIEVVFSVGSELRMFKFPGLDEGTEH
jgi:hypothetical protein